LSRGTSAVAKNYGNTRLARPGRPLLTDAAELVDRGFSPPAAQLVAALNALIVRAGLTQTQIRERRFGAFTDNRKFSNAINRRQRGPDWHIVEGIVAVCLAELDEPLEVGLPAYLELWEMTSGAKPSVNVRGKADAELDQDEVLEEILGFLWNGDEALLAVDLITGRNEGFPEAVAPALLEIARRDPGAVTAFLIAIESEDELDLADEVFGRLRAADPEIAYAVAAVPTTVTVHATRGMLPDPDPEPAFELSRLDPILGRGRRLAAQLRRGEYRQPVLEFVAAAGAASRCDGPGSSLRIGEVAGFDGAKAVDLLEAVVAAGPDGPELAGVLLTGLILVGHQSEAAACIELWLRSDDPALGLAQRAIAPMPGNQLAEVLVELTAEHYQRRPEFRRELSATLGAMPQRARDKALSSPVFAGAAEDVIAVLQGSMADCSLERDAQQFA
jgi:hypothetical protein